MTVVVSFVGIGIFAIPAGLMASSFTDQLRLDRNIFEDEVRKLVTSDQFTDEDRENLALEAERLHLSEAVFQEIIKKVEQEKIAAQASAESNSNSASNTSPYSISNLSPELTLEDYRKHISALRSLALSTQANALSELINNPAKATQLERDIWNSLKA